LNGSPQVYNVRKELNLSSRAIDFGGKKRIILLPRKGAKLTERRGWKAREIDQGIGPKLP